MLGAELEAAEHRGEADRQRAGQSALVWVLRACTADALFRRASHALSERAAPDARQKSSCVVFEPSDVTDALARLRAPRH